MLCINNQPFIDTDQWIDINRLISLEKGIIDRIPTALHELATFGPNVLTSSDYGTIIFLRRAQRYYDKNLADQNKATENFAIFADLVEFVYDLPFESIGRILIFYNEPGMNSPIHSDGFPLKSHRYEFLWLRTNTEKKFFVYDEQLNKKHYVTGYSAFFNDQCLHGSEPSQNMNFSIRVDGIFSEDFRKKLNINHITNYNEELE